MYSSTVGFAAQGVQEKSEVQSFETRLRTPPVSVWKPVYGGVTRVRERHGEGRRETVTWMGDEGQMET